MRDGKVKFTADKKIKEPIHTRMTVITKTKYTKYEPGSLKRGDSRSKGLAYVKTDPVSMLDAL